MENSNLVKEAFEKLLELRQDICSVLDTLKSKHDVLVGIYHDLSTTHRNRDFVFGLDSFFFQNKLIKDDCDHLSKLLKAIDNRVYCEYFTVYRMVKEYAINDINDNRVSSHAAFNQAFKPYKHLDDKQVHDIRSIKEIHQAIVSCNVELESLLANKESELRNDKQQSDMGLNIDNLVYMEGFKNEMLGAKIKMFYKYLLALSSHHTNYYTRLLLKAKLQMGIVEEDVILKQFNQSGITNVDSVSKRPLANSPVAIKETESNQIKSYVDYDNLPISKKSAVDNIFLAGGSDSVKSFETEQNNGSNSDGDGSVLNDHIDFVSHSDNIDNADNPDNVHNVDDDNNVDNVDTPDNVDNVDDADNNSFSNENKVDKNLAEESDLGSQIDSSHSTEFTQDNIGERVVVQGYNSIGVLRFLGNHVTLNVLRCGVEFDEPIGRNNGTVKGHKYFECEDMHGVLVATYKVSLVNEISLNTLGETEEN